MDSKNPVDWVEQSVIKSEHAGENLYKGYYRESILNAVEVAERLLKACLLQVFQNNGEKRRKPTQTHELVTLLRNIRNESFELELEFFEDTAYFLDKCYKKLRFPQKRDIDEDVKGKLNYEDTLEVLNKVAELGDFIQTYVEKSRGC